ncbi:MAG: zinc metallopeptidase [Thermoleophilia bacterium]|nr:zinc metallopeptidase [Thermoleophilia bacterium]
MRWRRARGQGRIEDRRGMGGVGMPLGVGGGGLGLVVLLLYVLLGGGGGGGFDVPAPGAFPQAPSARGGERGVEATEAKVDDFTQAVLGDVEATWRDIFDRAGKRYEPTTLVLFTSATTTGCGVGSAQTGPFYCPVDSKVYIDLSFFRELRGRFGAPGDFAQAYVIAHEVAHHVQNQLGISDDVRREQQRNPDDANDLSIRLELQADCFSGVWAHSAYEADLLEQGDLEEGLAAAAAVGDDRIQREATGRIDRESWTHGSSEQRTRWFRRGFDGGDPNGCDTFSGDV